MAVFSLFCHGLVIQSRKTCLERVYPSCMQGFWAAEMPPVPIGSPVPSSWLKLGGEGRNALDVPTAEPGHLAPELSLTARRTGNGGLQGLADQCGWDRLSLAWASPRGGHTSRDGPRPSQGAAGEGTKSAAAFVWH